MGIVVIICPRRRNGLLIVDQLGRLLPRPSVRQRPLPRTDSAGTVWLCRPGIKDNPCTGNLDATSITGTNKRTVQTASPSGSKKYDCFYLYPTASTETTVNSNLVVQRPRNLIAMAQAARFSQVCNVWAPMYRQITVAGLHSASGGGTDPGTIAYDSVLSDWKDFIAHYDDGHPIIFIGHSQGSVMMIKLLRGRGRPESRSPETRRGGDHRRRERHRPDRQDRRSDLPAPSLCTSSHESGCVIAYSSFPSEPPSDSMFGRPGQGISLNWGQTATTGVQVACVNPADIGGGTTEMSPYFPIARVIPMPSRFRRLPPSRRRGSPIRSCIRPRARALAAPPGFR